VDAAEGIEDLNVLLLLKLLALLYMHSLFHAISSVYLNARWVGMKYEAVDLPQCD
jgi:hypothetical protein